MNVRAGWAHGHFPLFLLRLFGVFFLLAVIQFNCAGFKEVVPLIPEPFAVARMVQHNALVFAFCGPQATAKELNVFGQGLSQRAGHDDHANVRHVKPL